MSQYELGFMLILGEGADKDIEKGLQWMEKAAENGEAFAMRLLSDVYQNGLFGVDVDAEKAKYWGKRSGRLKDGI